MYERIAETVVLAIYAYVGIGVVFALLIVFFGFARVDSETKGAGVGFRAIIFPGAVAMWPLLLKRWMNGSGEPPLQKDPHR